MSSTPLGRMGQVGSPNITLLLDEQILKRLLDMILAIAGLILLLPVLLIMAVFIILTSPGPVLYKSLRIGKDFRPFYMYKFRTMQTDADSLRDTLRKQANLEGTLFKIKEDPRVTRVGKFLRASSLDELPQLINVVLGNMSLVGPRPLPPDESRLFDMPYTVRFEVLPGITGVWQVSGRSKLDFQKLCRLERAYVLNRCLWTDLKIMFATVPAVLCRSGAY